LDLGVRLDPVFVSPTGSLAGLVGA